MAGLSDTTPAPLPGSGPARVIDPRVRFLRWAASAIMLTVEILLVTCTRRSTGCTPPASCVP